MISQLRVATLICAVCFAPALCAQTSGPSPTVADLAMRAYDEGRFDIALQLLREAADTGDGLAMEIAGMMLTYGEQLYGTAVPRDSAGAGVLFERAALAGSAVGRYFSCTRARPGAARECAKQPL